MTLTPLKPWQYATLCTALTLCALLTVPGVSPGLSGDARLTLAVFALATCAWIATPVDDTYIALGAGLALTATGVISSETLFGTLGDETVWLLICAFVLAAAVARTGLAGRAAAFLVSGARTVRQLTHLTTAALVVTAFAVPATSGRAALALPVFLALAKVLADHRRLVVMLALLFPTVILLSAVATLIGAGAHLITVSVLWEATGERIGFTQWLLLGLPLAAVSSHLAAEAVLLTTTRRTDRCGPVRITAEQIQEHSEKPVTGTLGPAETRCAALLATVVVLWCSEPLHQVPPAVVALIGAVVAVVPRTRHRAPQGRPRNRAVVTAALHGGHDGDGRRPRRLGRGPLAGVGAAGERSAVALPGRRDHGQYGRPPGPPVPFGPLQRAGAAGGRGRGRLRRQPGRGALASTAAAGFCHTLPASAKPVTLFSDLPGTPTYTSRDLLRLSAVLAPLTAAVVLAFALAVWPLFGVPVLTEGS